MNYLLDRQSVYKNQSRRRPIWGRLGLSLGLVLLLWWLGPWIFAGLAGQTANISKFGLSVGGRLAGQAELLLADFSNRSGTRQTKLDLAQKNARLTLERDYLKRQLADQVELTRQFESLTDSPTGLGRVLTGPGHLSYDVLLISLDKERGAGTVRPGQEVRVAGYLSLGQVVSRTDSIARVKMYSSANTHLRAVLGAERIPIVVSGRGQGNWLARLPESVPVEVGQSVMIATEPNRLLGLVREVKLRPDEANQYIFISLPINFYQLNWVEFYD